MGQCGNFSKFIFFKILSGERLIKVITLRRRNLFVGLCRTNLWATDEKIKIVSVLHRFHIFMKNGSNRKNFVGVRSGELTGQCKLPHLRNISRN